MFGSCVTLSGLVHQLDGPADDVGVAEIVSLPKLVGQHDYGLRGLSRRRIGGNQPAPLLRADAPMIWSVRRNIHRLNVFREVAVRGREIPPIHGGDVFERLGLAKLIDLWAAEADVVAVVAGLVHQSNLHNAIRAGIRKRIDQHGVNHGEDGARGADAEGKRENGGEGETRAFAELTGRITQVR